MRRGWGIVALVLALGGSAQAQQSFGSLTSGTAKTNAPVFPTGGLQFFLGKNAYLGPYQDLHCQVFTADTGSPCYCTNPEALNGDNIPLACPVGSSGDTLCKGQKFCSNVADFGTPCTADSQCSGTNNGRCAFSNACKFFQGTVRSTEFDLQNVWGNTPTYKQGESPSGASFTLPRSTTGIVFGQDEPLGTAPLNGHCAKLAVTPSSVFIEDSGVDCGPAATGASNSNTYITKTAHVPLGNSQSLGSLAGTGLLLNTITNPGTLTGTLSRYAGTTDPGANKCLRQLGSSGEILQTVDVTPGGQTGYATLVGGKLQIGQMQGVIGLGDLTGVSTITPTQGNGTTVQMAKGTATPNHCVMYDADGNLVDAGGVCGLVQSLQTRTGALTLAFGTTGNDVGVSSTVSTITLNIPNASGTSGGGTLTRGLVTTGAQSFGGTKTFDNIPVLTNGPIIPSANGDTLVAQNAAATLKSKTFDAEDTTGTGNVLKIPEKIWLGAAGCNGATATSFWDLPPTNAPTPTCAGSNTHRAVLAFDDTNRSAESNFRLPDDWTATGGIDARIAWTTTPTSGGAKWQVYLACQAPGATDDPAFVTANAPAETATGSPADRVNTTTITGATATSCNPGSMLHVKLVRDSTDTITTTVNVVGVELTVRRSI